MKKKSTKAIKKVFGAKTRTVDLSKHFNWPCRAPKDEWWQNLAKLTCNCPTGKQYSWGIPFELAQATGPRVIRISQGMPEVTIRLNFFARFVCFLHTWAQIPRTVRMKDPTEGLVVAEYKLNYADGSRHVQPVRGRFEVAMDESPGPPWLVLPFDMPTTADPIRPPDGTPWGLTQCGRSSGGFHQSIFMIYAMPNPHPEKKVLSLTIRGLQESPMLIGGLTMYQGASHPLRHLPRRTYRVSIAGKSLKLKKTEVDFGVVARIEKTSRPRDRAWLNSQYVGTMAQEPARNAEDLMEVVAAEDATLSVTLEGRKKAMDFSIGEAFHKGMSLSGKAKLEVLGKRRQWLQVRVVDGSTGKPTPTRIHFSGSRGEYLAPYGHHSQVNTNWFEDYGADVVVGERSYAYVPGEFTTDMPVGDIYVEICKGFEYEPVRKKMTIKPGQKILELKIDRWKDLRSHGWVTADTHVHFISPHTAWLEAQGEGVNVVNLLASQWGRLFTNVGDYTGRVGVVEDDTIVYVGTENRNHMLGHMSMLGTKGLPVFPMCCGGPGESWVGDPDFRMLAEWALENKRKGGLVIRPHFPSCGHTEDPVPILNGLVDALEIRDLQGNDFPSQEWYRYLNCGYRVAIVGGTDKMSARTALGWQRTYAKIGPNRPFTYENWMQAVRAGRTFASSGPVVDIIVEGRGIGDTIRMPANGGTLEVHAMAESFWPLGKVEIVHNGRVVACKRTAKGSRKLCIKERIRVGGSGWVAARCSGYARHPGAYTGAHTSPVYIKCGQTRAFDGSAAEHMLALVEGGIEYMNTLATVFDESSRKRMVKLFKEAQKELKGRLVVEASHTLHHGSGQYHIHGHGQDVNHHH